jgi:dihydrofolate synthase/folylpolyglutamate synthase
MSDLLRAPDAALARLHALHPKLIDLSLDRVERLLEALGRPQDRLPPTIHVAGTNGKGSTTAFLRAIAEAAGLRVHVFTSPHLVRFAERIRLAGVLISDAALTELLERVERANAELPITFFEITTAAALLAFSETPADLCLLEVGLGGRFDATNVISKPTLSVITPVDYDHQDFLGVDLARIAWEKAGVIKGGCPVASARQAPVAEAVIAEEADALGAPLSRMGREFDAVLSGDGLVYTGPGFEIHLPRPALEGPHQADNAGLAVAAALALNDPRITKEALAKGLKEVVWPARMQRLTAGPLAARAKRRGADVWLDGGHNPHAARALVRTADILRSRDGRPTVLVAGLLKRKDAQGVFAALKPFRGRIILTDFAADGAASLGELSEAAARAGVVTETASDVEAAVADALALQGPPPHVIIWGSLHLAGEVLAMSPETWPV